MRVVDLRSDTVTRPTPAMRQAMAEAEVGDDVWGDDPTVIELEAEVARVLGKEAAVYVPSGAMGNLVSVRSHTRPGDELFIHELAHIVVHEQAGAAVLAGVQTRMLPGDGGVLEVREIASRLRDPSDVHHARQSLLCLENTIGEVGGRVLPQERLAELAGFAHEHGALHAVRHHVERLADDHRNARRLAEGLRSARLLRFDPEAVETNIVIAKTTDSTAAPDIVSGLADAGVLCAALDDRTVRFVTHLDVDFEAVDAAISAANPVLS
jgi:threonine aldolase